MMESSKRAKAPGSTSQNVQCLVDGCNADLTQCRDYHRRHKVCEFHSKSPTVTIGGREQRFCQQCSRFHSLVEFDDVKRSCRKRLDGHNRRRRKPQPELRNAGLVLPSQQGGSTLLSFSTPQMCSTAVSSSWTSIVKPKHDFVLYNNQLNWNSANTCPETSSAHGYKGVNHLQFMQNAELSVSQPLLESGSRCGGHTNSGQKIFSDGLNHQVIHSDSALSLLSSRSAPAITREAGYNSMVHHHPDSMSSQSQTAHGSQFSSPGQFLFPPDIENKPAVSETGSQVSSNATFQFQEMFQNGPDESSASASHQTLTFLWE